eukprot:167367-Amphidinium_carterae.1
MVVFAVGSILRCSARGFQSIGCDAVIGISAAIMSYTFNLQNMRAVNNEEGDFGHTWQGICLSDTVSAVLSQCCYELQNVKRIYLLQLVLVWQLHVFQRQHASRKRFTCHWIARFYLLVAS